MECLRAELEHRQKKIERRRNDISYGETQKAQLLKMKRLEGGAYA